MARHFHRSPGVFFAELKRRRVIRVMLVYTALAWLLVDVAGSTFPYLGLPDWAVTLVIGLVVLGFPLAAVLGWAYDITPAGVERTGPRDAGGAGVDAAADRPVSGDGEERPVSGLPPPGESASGARLEAAVHTVAVGAPAAGSLAVLPFANLSPDEENEYFSDGMTDELAGALSRVPGLRVAARSSAFAFKGQSLDVREIGARLNVAGVVEGSVRRVGRRVRINVQLVDVADGCNRWSRTFDHELTDIFAAQEEIASSIVSALEPGGGSVATHAVPGATEDVEGYILYLKGRYFWNRRTEESLRKSIECFKDAVRRDPDYGLAHAGLADAYSILLDYGVLRPDEALSAARAAAERALEIDSRLPEAHASLAVIRQMVWDWSGAEAAFHRALALDADSSAARHRYALFLAWTTRPEAALEEMRRAHALDPLSLVTNTGLGWIHYYARRYDEAVQQLHMALELDSRFVNAQLALGCAYLQQGEHLEAVRALETAAELSHESPGVVPILACAYMYAGRHTAAQAVLSRLWDHAAHDYVAGYHLTLGHLATGDREEAFAELDRALHQRCPQLVFIGVEPLLDPLRRDPRFDGLLASIGLGGAAPARTGA